jgi:hypothetical protein
VTFSEVTVLVLIAGLLAWIVYDLIAYVRGGNSATISRVMLGTAAKYPVFALAFVFLLGVLTGHLFVPQHVSP